MHVTTGFSLLPAGQIALVGVPSPHSHVLHQTHLVTSFIPPSFAEQMGADTYSLLRDPAALPQRSNLIWCCVSIISIAFLIGFIVLAAIFLGLFVTAQNRANSLEAKQEQQCLSSQCVSLSAAVLASLNETVDPCEDFYQFACGGWESTNAIPKGVCACVHARVCVRACVVTGSSIESIG